MWRHLAAGGLTNAEARLTEGLRTLKRRRDDSGKWRSFPFYYTLLALCDIDSPLAVEEMKHAAGVCERYLQTLAERQYYRKATPEIVRTRPRKMLK